MLFCLLGLGLFSTAALAQDPGIADTVRIDSVAAFTNAGTSVPIYFYNDEPLAGIEVTFRFSSPAIQIDSFSFAGGRIQFYSIKGLTALPGGHTIYCILSAGETLIPTGNGMLGKLFLSWDVNIAPQVAVIDTITITNVDVVYSTSFSTTAANNFKPRFRQGKVNIQQGFGCCIGVRGNFNGDTGETVNIADLTAMVNYLFKGGAPADCPAEANINADTSPDANVADLTYLVNFLFKGGPGPQPCN